MNKVNSFVQFIVEQIQDAGSVSCRSMFGGYAIYCDTKVVALVCDNELFIKPTQIGKKFIGKVKETPPYPGAKPYFFIQDGIDDKQWMSELIRLTATELPLPKLKKPMEKKQGKKENA